MGMRLAPAKRKRMSSEVCPFEGKSRPVVPPGRVVVTVTVAETLPVPPAPVQERVKVLVAERAPVDWIPLTVFEPFQAPPAVHPVALVEDHVSVEASPGAMEVGLAERFTVGAGGGEMVSRSRTVTVRVSRT